MGQAYTNTLFHGIYHSCSFRFFKFRGWCSYKD